MDRNGDRGPDTGIAARSLSARRAWIEIQVPTWFGMPRMVALRKESVDRNMVVTLLAVGRAGVALRKESVDRNRGGDTHANRYYVVALRKESVDRNLPYQWGVWTTAVALRKESVDRNPNPLKFCAIC